MLGRYKGIVELQPENHSTRKLAVAIKAQDIFNAQKQAMTVALNYFLRNPAYPEEEKGGAIGMNANNLWRA